MVVKLYKVDASPPVRSVLMTIEALNITNVEYIDVNLLDGSHMKDEYLKKNPQHTVPLLQDEDFCIWDSHAIATYLVSKFGKDDSLYPADLKKRAVVDQRLHFDSGILFPAVSETVQPVFIRGEKTYRPESLSKIEAAYVLIESFLTTPWLAGENLTLADLCCVSSISSMNAVKPIDKATYPRLANWLARCSELDAYKKGNVPGLNIFSGVLKARQS